MININDIDLNELKWKEFFDDLTPEEADILNYDFEFLARKQQLKAFNSKKKIILMLAGRSWGKSFTLVHLIKKLSESHASMSYIPPSYAQVERILLPTIDDVFGSWEKPDIKLHRGFIEFKNGSKLHVVSGESYERIRGLNTSMSFIDELASFQYPEEAYEQVVFSNRLGDNPQIYIATTPKPISLIKNLVKDDDVEVITGSTFENKHIDFSLMKKLYDGTLLGRQELYGEILSDIEGALWKWTDIEPHRVKTTPVMDKIVVSIDPAVSNNQNSDETGIIVAGLAGEDAYILDDLSGKYSPDIWALKAVNALKKYDANYIIIEKNQGGDLLKNTIKNICKLHNLNMPMIKTVFASRGKMARVEPIYPFYERGKVHHTKILNKLEEQMTEWSYTSAKYSPDRIDALVWALTDLFNVGSVDSNWIIDW